ncbi:hypothetical protein BDV26DRAFT_295302 [Aspergillus bertholletiae]|uniref:LysM domain-containing protein n=1 Tax=Aspergillus bertholletiae TaxID=1226010 RepID=A0A5N7AZ23_9EURO|nr:hypothetical protein BDV26DRAFT_295302 [Aspergillus bertholletiae]
MAPFQLALSLLLVVITALTNAVSTTWEIHPSHPTMSGTAPNCNKWYTTKKGDSCYSVQRAYGISAANFLRWNPSVSKDCRRSFWPDISYCVGVGPAVPTAPTSTRSSTTTTIRATYTFNHTTTTWTTPPRPPRETAWPPTKTQGAQPTSCTRWHEVLVGDTCDTIANRYSSWITKEELLEWNPALRQDCDYPFVGYFVCVMIRPPSYTFSYPTGSTTVVIPAPTPYTPPPPVCPNPTMTTEPLPSRTQPGMPTKCQLYYKATPGDSCAKILSQYNIPTGLLHEWNPALGPQCRGLLAGYSYCLLPDGFVPMPPTVTKAPAPTQTGIASNCKAWYRRNQSETCAEIVLSFGTFSEADFKAWSPAVGKKCTELVNGNWYCVAVPDTPSTRTASVPAFPTSVPRQSNVIKNCTAWWHISEDEDCYDVARLNNLSVEDFLAWNPDVRSGQFDCKILPLDYEICVGVRPELPVSGCRPLAGLPTPDSASSDSSSSSDMTLYPTSEIGLLDTTTDTTSTIATTAIATTTALMTQCEDASCTTETITTEKITTITTELTATSSFPPLTSTVYEQQQ